MRDWNQTWPSSFPFNKSTNTGTSGLLKLLPSFLVLWTGMKTSWKKGSEAFSLFRYAEAIIYPWGIEKGSLSVSREFSDHLLARSLILRYTLERKVISWPCSATPGSWLRFIPPVSPPAPATSSSVASFPGNIRISREISIFKVLQFNGRLVRAPDEQPLAGGCTGCLKAASGANNVVTLSFGWKNVSVRANYRRW